MGSLKWRLRRPPSLTPIKPPAADSSAVLAIVLSVLENMSAALNATPATSEEESVTHVTISAALADEPAGVSHPLQKQLAMLKVPPNWNTQDG